MLRILLDVIGPVALVASIGCLWGAAKRPFTIGLALAARRFSLREALLSPLVSATVAGSALSVRPRRPSPSASGLDGRDTCRS